MNQTNKNYCLGAASATCFFFSQYKVHFHAWRKGSYQMQRCHAEGNTYIQVFCGLLFERFTGWMKQFIKNGVSPLAVQSQVTFWASHYEEEEEKCYKSQAWGTWDSQLLHQNKERFLEVSKLYQMLGASQESRQALLRTGDNATTLHISSSSTSNCTLITLVWADALLNYMAPTGNTSGRTFVFESQEQLVLMELVLLHYCSYQ